MTTERLVQIVEVGLRDGLQNIETIVPTEKKIAFLRRLHAAGLRRIEIGSFVSAKAVPQMADTPDLLAVANTIPTLDPQVLTPNERRTEQAILSGARHIAFILSVSEKHSVSNVRRRPYDSAAEYERIIARVPAYSKVRLNIATAFDCPFEGLTRSQETLALLECLIGMKPDVEVCLCDTTGRVTPDRVTTLFETAQRKFPQTCAWAFHGHDTYGLGVANALAAYRAGVRIFDASVAGLGGCPFAPGATGNIATEDLVWTLQTMGVDCKIDLPALFAIATDAAALPGAAAGGRVRNAMSVSCGIRVDA